MIQDDPARDRSRGFALAAARGVHPAFAGVATVLLSLLMAVAALVLLVACANVAGMLLARASVRQTEVAVRLALGATRGRLVRQLLVESGVLAFAGSLAGMLLTMWAAPVLSAVALAAGPTGAPIAFDLGIDRRVLLFTGAIMVLTTVVCGLVPALQATRASLVPGLKGENA